MPASRVLSHQTGDEKFIHGPFLLCAQSHGYIKTEKFSQCSSAVAVTLEDCKYVTLLNSAAITTKLVGAAGTLVWPSGAGHFRWRLDDDRL